MNESNPYAPPQVAELEAQVSRCWLLQGDSLLVKNGAVLPRVDLETGFSEHDGELHIHKVTHQRFSLSSLFTMLLAFASYWATKSLFDFGVFQFFPLIWIFFFVFSRFTSLSGKGSKLSTIWFFVDAQRYKRKKRRRHIRLAVMAISMLVLIPLFVHYSSDFDDFDTQITLLFLGIGIFFAIGIWHALDRFKLTLKYHSDDWLKIASIHPKARAFFEDLEMTERTMLAEEVIPKTRLVRTMYLYRLPINMLLHTMRNPLTMLSIVIMKFLRSKYLEQLFYDSSEASKCAVDALSTDVRDASAQWLAQHPSWTLLGAAFLDSPMGNLLTETISLTSADRASVVLISQFTMPQTPRRNRLQYAIITWIGDGKNTVETYNCPYLALEDPQLLHRTYAQPSEMLEEHMTHRIGHEMYFPRDANKVYELLNYRLEKTNTLLEAKKIHSPVKEYVNVG